MSDFPTSSGNTVVYCTADDIVRVLQLGANSGTTFSSSTTPTRAQVWEFILEAQEQIDQVTRHAWRERQVTSEYFDFDEIPIYNQGAGIRIPLPHRAIKTLDGSGASDALTVFAGTTSENYLTTKTEGRANDFWLDYKQGVLFLKLYWPVYRMKKVQMTYRYGETTVPKDIQKACALMVAKMILLNEDRSARLVEGGDGGQMVYDQRVSAFQREIDRILENRTEFFVL